MRCSSCSASVADDQKFCGQCGTVLTRREADSEGERKQVTVLFADVVGSMALAERLDADELAEVMRGLFVVCREAVETFGGTVDKFTGDGIMAVFGAPVAQEDHARRAGHAALRLVEQARAYSLTLRQGLTVAVRVGLNSGEVVAGSVGETFTALGHAVGLAQRMETNAAPDSVCVSARTAAILDAGFALTDLGPVEVKGASQPIRAFRLGAPRGGPTGGRRRTPGARTIGRAAELDALREALADAQEGRARVVGIVGDAGTGKSRLCEDLVRHAVEAGFLVRRTAGVSHAQNVPLLPILGFLRDHFAIVDTDGVAAVRAKIADTLLGLDSDFAADLALVYDFMEVPDPALTVPQLSPEARRRRLLELFGKATVRRSVHSASLLVLEDLHWFDTASATFLAAWLPSFLGTRTLVVLNFRPEFQADWMAHSYYRQLSLAPLDPAASLELLDELLGTDRAMADLTAQLQARTGGNPFFIEEMVRSLVADGTLAGSPGAYRTTEEAAHVRVPATVQAVLAARIDRLGSTEKAVLQAAAVIGRTFPRGVLGAVVELGEDELADAVAALCRAELLQPTAVDRELQFWHPLTQEVAYGSLLTAPRRRLHAATARALVAQGADLHDQLAPLIATHWEAASDAVEAARWQFRAALRATFKDYAEAKQRLGAVIEHLRDCADAEPEIAVLGLRARGQLMRLGARTGMATQEANRLFAEAEPIARRLGDVAVLSGLSIGRAAVHLWAGEVAEAAAGYTAGAGWADQGEDVGLRTFATMALGPFSCYTGPVASGLAALDVVDGLCSVDASRGALHAGYSVDDFQHVLRAWLHTAGGDLRAARVHAQIAAERYELRPYVQQMVILSHGVHLADWSGEHGDSAEWNAAAARQLAAARDSGDVWGAVRAVWAQAVAALLGGSPGKAATLLDAALAEVRERRCGLQEEAVLLAYRARAHGVHGDRHVARSTAAEAVAVAQRQGAALVECLAHLVRTRVLREGAADAADLQEARLSLESGQRLAAATGAGTYAAFLAEEGARLAEDDAALAACVADFEAIGATGHAARLRKEVG
ncbi:MAG: adenylate/guanylate cyclase domain-containing protein [Sporichthyaceae bacterium]